MPAVRLINSSANPIHLVVRLPSGVLKSAVVPGSRGLLPGSADVDSGLLDALKGNKVVQSYFESGALRATNYDIGETNTESTVAPPPVPALPVAEEDEIPEASPSTPADAPWATGTSK